MNKQHAAEQLLLAIEGIEDPKWIVAYYGAYKWTTLAGNIDFVKEFPAYVNEQLDRSRWLASIDDDNPYRIFIYVPGDTIGKGNWVPSLMANSPKKFLEIR